MSLKQEAVKGISWSFIETFGNQGIQFIIGIILARLLLPEDYGIVGVLAIFMGIAGVLVDSGFKTSIIRGKDLTEIDFSTIFYVNLGVSLIVGLILFSSSTPIALLFNKPELTNIIKVYALIPIINGFGLVQTALQFKNLQFKRNAKISLFANLIAGLSAVYMAFHGFSFWALVWRTILVTIIYNALIWITSSWRPQLKFSMSILKKHFQFSSKLLITGLVDSFFDNIYSFIFGKYFSFKELGFFTRGKGYVNMVSRTFSIAIQKVNTPLIAASGKDDKYKIATYSELLRGTVLIIFPVTILLIVIAEPMIIFLIGEKWRPAIPYLRILAISGMIYPVLNANSSLIESLGRSDLILKSVLISRSIQVLILIITLNFNSITVTWGIVLHSIIVFYVSFWFVKRITNEKIFKLVRVLVIPFIISCLMGLIIYIFGFFVQLYIPISILLVFQIILCFLITLTFIYLFKLREIGLIKSYLLKNKG